MTVLVFSSKESTPGKRCWTGCLGNQTNLSTCTTAFVVQIFTSSLHFNHDLHEHGSAAAGQQLSPCTCSFLGHSLENQHVVSL